MIIVIEGISAAGKTTYARQFGGQHHLPEIPVKGAQPAQDAPAEEHARFWADHNAARFQMAVEIERQHGFAICDTDPMKVHFAWCMERAGFAWPDKFETARSLVRKAIAERRLGFADRYFVKRIAPDVARAQKEGDATRSRRRFDMHLALQPHLIDWFTALSEALPDRVEFAFPQQVTLQTELKNKAPEEDPRRFDVSVFDALVERLPN